MKHETDTTNGMANRTALYFGSFNPVHNGHLMLAQWCLNAGHADELWFVVSPQNPFKEGGGLLPAAARLAMLTAALEEGGDKRMGASDVELTLPSPSYTVRTVRRLRELYPGRAFSILMGADNLPGLPAWREAEELFSMVEFMVYPRDGTDISRALEDPALAKARVRPLPDAPRFDISSTYLRNLRAACLPYRHFVPNAAARIWENT